jgi:hypothetical protein
LDQHGVYLGNCYIWSILQYQGAEDRIAKINVFYQTDRITAMRFTTATGAFKDLGPVNLPGSQEGTLNFTQEAPLVGLMSYLNVQGRMLSIMAYSDSCFTGVIMPTPIEQNRMEITD